jgi:hypothetical protein
MTYKLLGFKPSHPCASGTAHSGGAAISAAIRDQHVTALRSYPAYARSKRSVAELAEKYRQAMREKRSRVKP